VIGRTSTGSARTAFGVLASLFFATPAFAQSVAITGGKVIIGDGSAPIDNATILIANGRVVAAGIGVAVPAGTRTIDAKGKWVTPGIVAGFTRLGLAAVDAVDGANDTAANASPFNASIDIAPAINGDVAAIAISRAAGVTRAIVSPETGNSIFAGQGAVIDTGTDTDPVTRAKAFQFVEFGEMGARRSGGSRPALFANFRNALAEAKAQAAGTLGDNALLRRADAAALGGVVAGTTKLLIHVDSAPDILSVLALRKDFPLLNIVLVGATEGWRVAGQIAAAKVPVLASALNDLPDSFAQLAATQSNIGRMKAAGVEVAIGMIDDDDTRQAQHVLQYAGNLVALKRVPGATGLSWNEAFAAITSKPATIIGMGAEIGSLKAGRRGDVVIWDGDPLELSTAATRVFIDGVEQNLTTRQTRLRDRYAKPGEGALPKAFDR
jgi:imidazolonepropionase-like amidohydrolase